MKKKGITKIISVVSAILCLVIAFGSVSFAIESDNNFLNVDSISICERHGIVEGESIQLTAALTPESAVSSAVKWYSSNPDVVSCTEKGLIKGVSAGGYADIYCEAVFGSAVDKIRVYCAEKVNYTVRSDLKGMFNVIYSEPSQMKPLALHFNKFSLFSNLFSTFIIYIIPTIIGKTSVNGSLLASGKCEIRGKIGSYAYISFYSGETERDGFIRFTRFEDTSGLFLTLSATDMDVWGNGKAYDNKKLTTKYKGDVKWEVGDEKIISFDDETGQVIGLKPGVTTITATADGVSQTCTVHSLYHWPQTWTTQTNRNTNLYQAVGAEYKADKAMPEGKKFIVYGDEGGSEGWAYGNISGTDSWGYVPISHVSTKNTISYYNSFGWTYPLKNEEYNYIYSPFAPRASQNDEHRGMDINEKENQADIEGQPLVAPFNGIVKKAASSSSAGNYICITSETDVDTVTGEKLTAIYMHMKYLSLFSDGESVEEGQIIGYAGNTGGSTGSHLHFEVNNINAAVDDSIRRSYTYTINPIYFYLDKEFKFNYGCSAYENKYGFYWYNYNK